MSPGLAKGVRSPWSAVIAGALVLSAPVLASHSWGGYHWARQGTLYIRLGDSVSTAWDTYLRAAAKDWSAPAVVDLLVTTSNVAPSTCRPVYGRAVGCSYRYGSNGWLGLGTIWTSGGHIVQATAQVTQLSTTKLSATTAAAPAGERERLSRGLGPTRSS